MTSPPAVSASAAMGSALSTIDRSAPGASSLKRRAASAALSDADESTRKKAKTAHADDGLAPVPEDDEGAAPPPPLPLPIDGAALAADLAEELECGCCSAVVYRPVVVMPCQHYFCGRCARPSSLHVVSMLTTG
jgi:E3 ubiquitin-protein ligase CHFR